MKRKAHGYPTPPTPRRKRRSGPRPGPRRGFFHELNALGRIQETMTGFTDAEIMAVPKAIFEVASVVSTGLELAAAVTPIGATMVALKEALVPVAAASTAMAVWQAATYLFGTSSKTNKRMSGQLFVANVTVGTKKKWPAKAGIPLKLDHSWQKYSLAASGKIQVNTLFVGDAAANYTSTPSAENLPNQNYFDLNPNEKITGSDLYTTLTNPSSDKLYSANSKGFIDITNNSNVGVFYRIDWYRCKNSTGSGPVEAQQVYMQSENLGITTIAAPGLAGSTGSQGYYATAGTGTYEEAANGYIGLNPNGTLGLSRVWSREKSQNGFLPATAALRYSFDVNFGIIRSKREMNHAELYQKGSMVALLTYHGEASVGTTGGTHMVHAPCSVGWCGYQRLTFATVDHNERAKPIYAAIKDNTAGTVFKAWTAEASADVLSLP